jgi:hypothetical protein
MRFAYVKRKEKRRVCGLVPMVGGEEFRGFM